MQQINLYLAQYPDKQKKPLPKKLVIVILIFSCSIIAAASIGYWKIQSLKNQLALETSTLNVVESALKKLKTATEKSAANDELKVKLIDLKEKVTHKKAVKAEIDNQVQRKFKGFSELFFALARQDAQGIWLTNIHFANSSREVTLKGMAKTPQHVAQYLARLASEPAFSGISFTGFKIEKTENTDSQKYLAFVLSTHELEETIESVVKTPAQKFLEAKIQ